MTATPLITAAAEGLYCTAGDFYVDPWQPVSRAIVTHAHADHARPGSGRYLAAAPGANLLRLRLGADADIELLPYGESRTIGGVQVSLHPAGHMLGAAQVRVEHQGEVWVVSGDYKLAPDATCPPFAPLKCHTFVTESTFGLPLYRWPGASEVFAAINGWWAGNQQAGKTSVLFVYAAGKAQRVLTGIDASIGPIFTHGAVEKVCEAYRADGVALPVTNLATAAEAKTDWKQALILAPPSAQGTPWLRRFGEFSTGMASGWMRIRGVRRRKAFDRGFVLSDHVDWSGLLETIHATGAERVLATHGYSQTLARYLRSQGLDADEIHTEFRGETIEGESQPEVEDEP